MKFNYLNIIILVLICSCSTSRLQTKKRINSGKIIYSKYDVVTEKAAKMQNKGFKMGLTELFKDQKDSTELKALVNNPAHDVMMLRAKQDTFNLSIKINNDYYIQPRTLSNGNDSNYVIYTDRDSLYQCVKKSNNISSKCKSTSKLQYFDESKYEIKYLPNDTKIILGYKCFKITAKRNDKIKHTYEMYVTDEIILDFNYIINFKSINSKYLILELKKKTPLIGSYSGYFTNSIELN